jgi:hypothetical protein
MPPALVQRNAGSIGLADHRRAVQRDGIGSTGAQVLKSAGRSPDECIGAGEWCRPLLSYDDAAIAADPESPTETAWTARRAEIDYTICLRPDEGVLIETARNPRSSDNHRAVATRCGREGEIKIVRRVERAEILEIAGCQICAESDAESVVGATHSVIEKTYHGWVIALIRGNATCIRSSIYIQNIIIKKCFQVLVIYSVSWLRVNRTVDFFLSSSVPVIGMATVRRNSYASIVLAGLGKWNYFSRCQRHRWH